MFSKFIFALFILFPYSISAQDADIVRIVLSGAPKKDAAGKILQESVRRWPEGVKTRFLITPGGFMETELPSSWGKTMGWQTAPEELGRLSPAAEKAASEVLTPRLVKSLADRAKYLTLGVDMVSEKGLKGPHAELVGMFDLHKKRFVGWTGKSYPTAKQEDRLIAAPSGSHIMKLDGEKTLVLGCNDLNWFNPRALAAADKRTRRGGLLSFLPRAFAALKPSVVLHHPHATDSANIWRNSWGSMEKKIPALRSWASAIRYFNPNGANRQPLYKVLDATKGGLVYDLIIPTARFASRASRYFSSWIF